MSCTLPNSIRTALIEKSEIPHDTDWWQRTLNEVSRYSGSGKSDICDKYTEYSAYARCQRCLGYPSIRSPAAILSWVSIDRYTVFTQSVSPQSHESPPVQLSLSDARSHSVSVRVTGKPGTLYCHRNDPHHRNDPRHRNDPQSPPKWSPPPKWYRRSPPKWSPEYQEWN